MNAAQVLADSVSPDTAIRERAEKQLEAAAAENYHGYLHTLAAELANEEGQVAARQAAGLAFKNTVAARDAVNQPALTQRWLAFPDTITAPLKQSILSSLGTTAKLVGGVAAQSVSAVAAIELPVGKWPELIPALIGFAQNQENTQLRVATLQTIGYICEVISPEILSARSNDILTAVVQGARKEEPSHEVQKASMSAMYNSLEFIRDNFEREASLLPFRSNSHADAQGERNYIMQVVCEATQNSDVAVQVLAFECLVRIMSLYYEKMEFYMERALFGLTIAGMRNQEESVALQAIEFWSTVCEEEIDLAIEAQEAQSYGEAPAMESKHFGRLAMGEILPVLLDLLSTQNEDDDEDDFTRSMASALCLDLLAKDVGDEIVQPVVPFVEAGINQPNWKHREAAVMAFGSILDGPDPSTLAPLVTQALPALISMLQSDQSVPVRDTVAWTLSRITELMLMVIEPEQHLNELVSALVLGVQSSPRITNSCCSALNFLAAQLAIPQESTGDAALSTSVMSPYYPGIFGVLMPVSERSHNESNCRSAAYQTMANFIAASADDTLQLVQEVTAAMLARQEALLGMQNQLVGIDDRNNWNDMQIGICIVLQSAIHKSPALIAPFADRIMTNFLQLISSVGKGSAVLEDAFMTIGALATELEAGFTKYIEAFAPFLFTALSSFETYSVVQAAIYAVSDVSRAVGEALEPYANRLMVALLEVLRSPIIQRQVKPSAITAIGEIALVIGPAFTVYLETVMSILSQAGQMGAPANDLSLLEFVWTMREAIVEAFIGILNGMKADPTPFQRYVAGIMSFLRGCLADEERTDTFLVSSLGLIGDFGDAYKRAVKNDLMQEWVQSAIAQGRQRGASKRARQNAQYAQKAIKEVSK